MKMPQSFTARVIETVWLTPTVFRLRFESRKPFSYEAGQFITVIVPPLRSGGRSIKRCYSLASSPSETERTGLYELCIKIVDGGVGSNYLSMLSRGDLFSFVAPFGHLKIKKQENTNRSLCFIATGSGLAPFRSMALSKELHQNYQSAFCLFGARTENEVFYEEDFRRAHVKMFPAISSGTQTQGYTSGRVTDLLRSNQLSFPWQKTDFYLCGNGNMVDEVCHILESERGVLANAIHKETFSTSKITVVSGQQTNRPSHNTLVSALLLREFKA